MVYTGVTDLRTRPRVTQTNVTVSANTDILIDNIANSFLNTTSSENGLNVSFYTIQVTAQVAGKLYIVKSDGSEEYLSDPGTDWPAKFSILVTYVLGTDDSFNLRYSASGTLSSLIITEHGGVY